MKTLLIVYHSLTGGTRQMAEAAAAAAHTQEGVAVRLLRAQDAGRQRIRGSRGRLNAVTKGAHGASAESADEVKEW